MTTTDDRVTEFRVGGPGAKWARTSFISTDGVVFAPSPNSVVDFLAAGYDRTPTVVVGEHVYLPTGWLLQEHSQSAELCSLYRKIERQTRAASTTQETNDD